MLPNAHKSLRLVYFYPAAMKAIQDEAEGVAVATGEVPVSTDNAVRRTITMGAEVAGGATQGQGHAATLPVSN